MNVGDNYCIKKGVVYTILGDNGLTSSDKKYIFSCGVCSKDKELFPNGSLRAVKASIKNKSLSCGCGKNYSYSKYQQNIRIRRRVDYLGIMFRGYVGAYVGALKTRVLLESKINGLQWDTCTVSALLNDKRCIMDRNFSRLNTRKSSIIPDEIHIERALATGNYLKGTVFKRERTCDIFASFTDFWLYNCPLCSNDEYVKNNVCDGVFRLSTHSLKQGVRSCRCSGKYRFTEQQRLFQINSILNIHGGKFISWCSEHDSNNQMRKFWYDCNKGHRTWSNISCMIRKGYHCASCSFSGFDPSKKARFYIVRWYGYGESYLKFGITNRTVSSRVSETEKYSELDYEIMYDSGLHCGNSIRLAESTMKVTVKTQVCPKKRLPKGYTETTYDDNLNYDKLISILRMFVKDAPESEYSPWK